MTLPSDESKEDIKEALLKQVVALSLENTPEYKIAEQLKMSRYAVRKMRNGDAFKAALKEIGDQAVTTAKESFKAKLDELTPLALEALRHNLKEKKIEAVRVFVETVGLKNKEDDKPQDGVINVILPGTKQETVIATTGKEIKDA
jgi:hypothetical protein